MARRSAETEMGSRLEKNATMPHIPMCSLFQPLSSTTRILPERDWHVGGLYRLISLAVEKQIDFKL
jgi:hypothetical protein